MSEINRKELNAFIKSRANEDLRKSKTRQIIFVQIFSSIILFLLGASIWHIVVLIIATELIIKIIHRKVSKNKSDKYKQEYLNIVNH